MADSASDPLTARLQPSLDGRYRIERELGAGGMATVYLAEDVKHHRRVAIKVLHPELSAILGTERFLKEIELTANLQHPHILPLFDSGSADGLLFYVMPYVEGETLRGRLDRERQLPVADAVRIASEVADALEYAHKRAVIHRDIKPENVLLHDGRALVADFGIALAVQEAGGQRMTQTGLSLGTPQYMSPEQAMGERTVDARTDIYALGAVTYEMLVGEPPFTGPTAQAIVAQVMTASPPSLSSRRATVPPNVDEAVATALQKLPADRFGSASEFAHALSDPLQSGRRRAVRTASGAHGASRAIMATLVVVAMLAGLAGGYAIRRMTGSSADDSVVVSTLMPPAKEQWPVMNVGGGGFSISPDGRRVALITNPRDSVGSLVIRSLDAAATTALPGTRGATVPFWSPDGRSLGFFADHQLKTIDIASGTVRTLCPAPNGNGGAWNARGVILFAPEDATVLYRVSATGGDCAALPLRGVLPGTDAAVFFMPDGDHFVFSSDGQTWLGRLGDDSLHLLRANTLSESVFAAPDYLIFYAPPADLYAQRIDAHSNKLVGQPHRIFAHVNSPYGYLAVSASQTGTLLAETGGSGASAAGATLTVATRGSPMADSIAIHAPAWWFRLAHDGRRIALGGFSLSTMDMDRGVATVVATGSDSAVQTFGSPVWAPHDSMIAVANGYLHFVASVYDPRSGRARRLFDSPDPTRQVTLMDWSPDGRQLAFSLGSGRNGGHAEPWVYDVLTGTSHRLFAEAADVTQMRFSPDGRWLAYQSNVSGSDEIYLRAPASPGTPVRVSTAGGRLPRWRGDARELYYAAPNGTVLAVTVGAPGVPPSQPRTVDVSPPSGAAYVDMQPTPDGQRFLFTPAPTTDPGLTLIQNWRKLLPGSAR
ncbi:MAG TPA: protein kinase [Gemmatimonadaceae bacterium]|nr:protein kinase [Gemmatimonadaceae bacterium]